MTSTGERQGGDAHHVVIIGGGFGGLAAARALRKAPVRVTLIDRRNFHLFQPLLYQVATGGLSPANIASPLRSIVRAQRNTRVILGEAVSIDLEAKTVALVAGEVGFDSLIVATGAAHNYFGHPEWERDAPGLKTVEDATGIRRRILTAFEAAERDPASPELELWLTFVVVGGGATGVEMAGAVAELARLTMARDFRSIDPRRAKVVLLEGLDRLLPGYHADLSESARTQLEELGVEVRTGAMVSEVRRDAVRFESDEREQEISTRTVIWAAGVEASPLGRALEEAAGAELDRAGRVKVGPDLAVPDRPDVFVIGDLAHFVPEGEEEPLPGLAPVAMQQGRYLAKLIERRLRGRSAPGAFRYRDRGKMATVGRSRAVAEVGRLRFSGYPAWLAWLFIHLMYLVEFQNRILVLLQWYWNYFTHNRSARLITGPQAPPYPDPRPEPATPEEEEHRRTEGGVAR